MANNDSRASYARIGFTLLVGVGVAIAALVYLGGADSRKQHIIAETYSDNAVSGLSVGSEVKFRGVKVGEVKEISFVGHVYDVEDIADSSKILIRMALDEDKMKSRNDADTETSLRRFVQQGLHATVTSSGITGLSHVELNYPKTRGQIVIPEIPWHSSNIVIPLEPSILDSFSDAANRVMSQLDDMDFTSAWSNVNKFVDSVSSLASEASAIVEAGKGSLGEIMDEARASVANLRQLASEVKDNPSLLLRPRDPEELPETK